MVPAPHCPPPNRCLQTCAEVVVLRCVVISDFWLEGQIQPVPGAGVEKAPPPDVPPTLDGVQAGPTPLRCPPEQQRRLLVRKEVLQVLLQRLETSFWYLAHS